MDARAVDLSWFSGSDKLGVLADQCEIFMRAVQREVREKAEKELRETYDKKSMNFDDLEPAEKDYLVKEKCGVDVIVDKYNQTVSEFLAKLDTDALLRIIEKAEILKIYFFEHSEYLDNLARELKKSASQDQARILALDNQAIKLRNVLNIPVLIQNMAIDKLNLDHTSYSALMDRIDNKYQHYKGMTQRLVQNDITAKELRDIKISRANDNTYISMFHYSQLQTWMRLDKFLPSARKSRLLKYIYGESDSGRVRTKNGTEIDCLMKRIDAVYLEDLPEDKKLRRMEQAVLDMYWQVRKDQGFFDSRLADALEAYLNSPRGSNLPHKYGIPGVVPHEVRRFSQPPDLAVIRQNQREDFGGQLLKYFKTQKAFSKYCVDRKLMFNQDDQIDLRTMNDEQKARARVIAFDLMRRDKKAKPVLLPLFSSEVLRQDRKNHEFIRLYQKLKVALHQENLKTKRHKLIDDLMGDMEEIRKGEYLLYDCHTDAEKISAMQRVISEQYFAIRATAKSEKWFGSQSNLADALADFMKQYFDISKKEMQKLVLPSEDRKDIGMLVFRKED